MKAIVLFSVFIFFAGNLFARHGKVIESLEFESKTLDYPVGYSIYLPPGYDISQRSYPVLYLLHGYSDDETGWIQFGEANLIADKGIENGDFPPMIIVMPNGKVTWFCNNESNNDKWQDMFINEFIPFIEGEYRIRQKREFRAIAGLSMGGYGALNISMRNPGLFSSCVAFSSGVFTDEEIINYSDEGYTHFFGDIFGKDLKGEGRITEAWKANSPLHLIKDVPKEKLEKIRFYIDCGDNDFLYKGNSTLHILMRDLGIPHEYRVRDGSHSWVYWRAGLPEGLKFISETFHR
ncbi:Endo-1,4-beta-xylanase A precursor [hydrothermal vent metagenome]|uniref:Endo-1,4-beta-xylanase A n=1 Tax=hydrothermal vent metagenome TaxID=652676 RepID=A0A3B0TRQ4_9ZZZZ